MEKANAGAKEFGRNLLLRATGASDTSDEEGRNSRQSRPSYCEIVAWFLGKKPEKEVLTEASKKVRTIGKEQSFTTQGNSSGGQSLHKGFLY